MKYYLSFISLIFILLVGGCSYKTESKISNQNNGNPIIEKEKNVVSNTNEPKINNLSPEWTSLLNNLYVPAKYSDLCGFMSKNKCPEFSFVNGGLPEKFKNNIHGEKGGSGNADLSLAISDSKVGTFIIANKIIDIAVVPYLWIWGSSGNSIYIVEKKNDKAEVISRLDAMSYANSKPENINILSIVNNTINVSFNTMDPTEGNINLTCFFKDENLSEQFFKCNKDK